MTRLDLAPENDVIAKLKEALGEIERMKQVQPIGSDSIVPKIIETTNAYDITSVLDTGIYRVICHIFFTAETQLDPYANAYFKLFDMSGNVMSFSSLSLYYVNLATGDIPVGDGVVILDVNLYAATQFRAKIFVQASDSGAFTLEDIADGIPT